MTANTVGRTGADPVTKRIGAVLALQPDQTWWTVEQQAALASIGLDRTPAHDLMAFMHLCISTGLDPFRREVYLIKRKSRDGDEWIERWVAQTGIDGYRLIAERTGVFGGIDSTEFCGSDGQWTDVWLADEPPKACKVVIARTDWEKPVVSVVRYDEFVQTSRDGKPTGQWASKPMHMLAKVAEAYAIRRAFPRQTSGLIPEDAMPDPKVETRDDQRETLASRPWAAKPAGAVIDAEPGPVVVELDRHALWDELTEQARLMGLPVKDWAKRFRLVTGRNVEDATDAELAQVVASRRVVVAEAVGNGTAPGLNAPVAAEQPALVVDGTPAADSDGVVVEDPPDVGAPDTVDRHEYVDPTFDDPIGTPNGPCAVDGCGRMPYDDVHALPA